MSYHALARKYRPTTFAQMVGQKHVTTTLRAAIRKDKLSHAYVFAGPRGTGKTTVARLLAKALNCAAPQDADPCGTCETCRSIANGSYLDVLEIDAASHTGVDNIRELRDMAQYSPTKGGCRVFIIDEVHMLSKGAFNALLKILEEPPSRVFFFFATTEPTRIPRTILSRCQRFDFRLLTRQELAGRIGEIAGAEDATLSEAGLRMVVSLAEGSLRDGLSILDQLIAASEGPIDEEMIVQLFGLIRSEVYSELNEAISSHDSARALRLTDSLLASGHSLDAFAMGVVANFRNLLLVKIDPELTSALDLSPDQIETLSRQAEPFAAQDLLALIDRASSWYERIHRSTQPRILLEAALVEFTLFESRVLLSDLVRRLQDLTDEEPGGAGRRGGTESPGDQGLESGDAPGKRGGRDAASEARGGGRRNTADRGSDRSAGGSSLARDGAGDHDGRFPTATVNGMGGGTVLDGGTALAKATALGGATVPGRVTLPGSATAAETVPGWTGFIQTLLESHPGLASCLMEGLPSLDEDRRRMTIAFPADKAFQMRSLERERQLLESRVREAWGRGVKLQLVDSAREPTSGLRESIRREVAPTEKEVLEVVCQQDQPLSDLVELLAGEPVPDQEQEPWLREAAKPPLASDREPSPTPGDAGSSLGRPDKPGA